jgi:hypothetical protein
VGALKLLEESSLPNLDLARVQAAGDFHRRIAAGVATSRDSYDIIAIKGCIQPTAQSARIVQNEIYPVNAYNGTDYGGDGTVPRPSSHPAEWGSDSRAIFAAQKHSSLQNTEGVLHQLYGSLTGQLGQWMGGERVSVDVPTVIKVGDTLPVKVQAEGDDPTLALQAIATREDDSIARAPELLDSDGHGSYAANFSGLAAGVYKILVESAVPQRPVDPVTSITLVW